MVVFSTTVGWMIASNPLLKSADSIKIALLEKTPLGMSKKELTAILEKDIAVNFDGAYILSSTSDVNRIRMYLGNDYLEDLLFDTEVYAVWDFDDSPNLIRIDVKKETDGI